MRKLIVGDKVQWTSQSSGFTTTKTGEIMVVVPPNCDPFRAYIQKGFREISANFTVLFSGWGRDHESYLVKVEDSEHPNAKPRLYWPLVKYLQLFASEIDDIFRRRSTTHS